MVTALQHPVGQQVVVVVLHLPGLRLLVAPSCRKEVLYVLRRVALGEVVFSVRDGSGDLAPAPVDSD